MQYKANKSDYAYSRHPSHYESDVASMFISFAALVDPIHMS